MGTKKPFKDEPNLQQALSLFKKLFPWTLFAILPLLLVRFYFYPLPPFLHSTPTPTITHHSLTPFSQEVGSVINQEPCDYTNGEWVYDLTGPIYNGTVCGTIKQGQNCISHGRPDMGYLHWRWKPKQCDLPRFDPDKFLHLLKNKHLAFIGDSMARNQLESLICSLSTASIPNLVYTNGDDNKFRRWYFASHNVNISVYWSPFLVKGIEKSNPGPNHNRLYLDSVDEKWADDMDQFHMIVLSIGHWFLHPAVYFENGSVLGCHYCPDLNHTEIGFYDVLRKSLKTTMETIINRQKGINVILTTLSPSHFEGDWDKAGACPKTKPYNVGEKSLEGMEAEMRDIELEQLEAAIAKVNAKKYDHQRLRIEALDITKLSLLRPDGHPGPYMHPFPFSNGVSDRVQNDCLHWCLPGPVDTWNEIMLQIMTRWNHHQ